VGVDERVANHVDSFLVEALDNPRHRLMGTCHSPPYLSIHSPCRSLRGALAISASLGVRAYADVIAAAGPRGRAWDFARDSSLGFEPAACSKVRNLGLESPSV
jgi:hypothetical protein